MFKIIHDLSKLSDSERIQYCRDYSVYLGLNPDENRIDTIWMSTDSVRALVPYCRRGTTDLLRGIFGIDVTGLIKEDGPGYVSFQASGIDRRGRKEISVGAYSTNGLIGDRLAAAVAIAQTRALRRLTLQFVGGGLLDESEVSNTYVTDATPVAAPAAQPTLKPNSKVGNLVTPIDNKIVQDLKVEYHVPLPPHVGVNVVGIPTGWSKDAPEPLSEAAPAPKPAIPASVEAANAILAAEPGKEAIPPKKRLGRPRKSKNTVDMGDVSPSADIPQSQLSLTSEPPTGQKLTYVPTCPVCNLHMAADDRLDMFLCVKDGRIDTAMKPSMLKVAAPPVAIVTPAPVIEAVPPPKAISVLTDIEQKQVKARLAPFWVDILPKGGMTADDGISIWGKLIKYANSYFPDAPDYKQWTFDRWELFLERLDNFNAVHGAASLVEHINASINAK